MGIQKKFLCLVLASLPALIIFFNWHRIDKLGVYACSPEGLSYISTVQELVGKLDRTLSFTESALAIYDTRNWKGFILPQTYLPFYLVSGNDAEQALYLFQLFFLCAFLIYLLLFLSEFLSPWPSVAVTIAVSTVPWISDFSTMFDSYFPFMTVTLIAAYHLVRSNYFLNRTHSLIFGLAAGFAACIRPAELVLNFGIPMLGFLFLSYRNAKQFNWRDLSMILCLLVATSLAMIFLKDNPYGQGKSSLALFILIPLQASPLFFQKRWGLSPNVTLAFCSSLILFTIWWIPFASVFIFWQSAASIGAIAHSFPKPPDMNWFDFLRFNFGLLLGIGFLLPFSILGLRGCLRSMKMFQKPNLKLFDLNAVCVFLIYLYLLFVPISVTNWFPTLSLFYSLGISITLWVITLLLSLKGLRGRMSYVVTFATFLLAANQFSYLLEMTTGINKGTHFAKVLPRGGRTTQNMPIPPLYFQKLTEILSARSGKENRSVTISVVSRKFQFVGNIARTLAFVSRQEDQPISFVTIPKLTKDRRCEVDPTCVRDLFQKSDYVLIVDLEGKYDSSSPLDVAWADELFMSAGDCDLRRIGNIGSIGPAGRPEDFGLDFQVFEKVCTEGTSKS